MFVLHGVFRCVFGVVMFEKIYLHVGMHKTGSSSIQRSLLGYDDGVTKYANLGYENHSIPFYTAFSGEHQNYHIWKSAGLCERDIEEKKLDCLDLIRQSLSECSVRNIIFSGEDISVIPEGGIVEIKKFLEGFASKILVVGYFRDPLSFVMSNWQETIKSGRNTLAPQGPEYRLRFEKFIRLFGRDNVILKHFRKDGLRGGDVVTDFCSLVDIDLLSSSASVNESLSSEAIKCVYILNSLIDPYDGDHVLNKARLRFMTTISDLLPGGFSLPDEFCAGAVSREDCKWLESVTGVQLSGAELNSGDDSREGLELFFKELSNDTIDVLLDYLNAGVDFGRDSRKIVHRLYIECVAGVFSKRNQFSAERYLELNPDVKAAGVNPYEHYLMCGIKVGRCF